MHVQSYVRVTLVLFLVIGVGHALRLVSGWEAAIGGWTVPMWASWLAVAAAAALVAWGWRLHETHS